MKKNLINFSLISVTIIAFLFLLEGVISFYSTEDEGSNAFSKEFHSKHVRYNKHGYRDHEYSLEKPEGVFRVLVIGDSQTFGSGINNLEETWVKKLEAKLQNERRNASIEVLSISGPGWNSDTHLYELFKIGFKFNPDLIILAYYLNDIPFPTSVNCDSSDRKVIPNINIFQNSKLVSFIDFRINRLLEKLGEKPSYSDCLNQAYDSIGWEMNKFYLDIMGLSLSIKKIHFMITVIPLIHKLDNGYPLAGPHGKLKEFARQRNLEFLDFYENGFKNLDADNLKISKTDHHLNQNAGDIIVNTLFSKIKGLIKYKNLPYFNKAFTLTEILNEKPLLISLDNRINKQNSINTFILDSKTERLQVSRDSNQFIITKIQKGKGGENRVSSLETKLSLSGDYISQEKVFFHGNSKIPRLIERISKQSDIYVQTLDRIEPDSKGDLVAIPLGQRNYQFGLENVENITRIEIEKNIALPDPKVLDKWIFQNIQTPSTKDLRKEKKEIIIDIMSKNPSIYDTPEDINIIKHPNLLDKLSDSDMQKKFEEIILFQIFLTLERYRAKDYVNLLIELIEKNKPSLMALNAANRYRKFLLDPSSG